MRLQKPRRHFFPGTFKEEVSRLVIRAHQSSGLQATGIEPFYQGSLQAGYRVANSVTKGATPEPSGLRVRNLEGQTVFAFFLPGLRPGFVHGALRVIGSGFRARKLDGINAAEVA